MTIKLETLENFVGVVQSRDHRKPKCSGKEKLPFRNGAAPMNMYVIKMITFVHVLVAHFIPSHYVGYGENSKVTFLRVNMLAQVIRKHKVVVEKCLADRPRRLGTTVQISTMQ